jgi:hypothetical protein
MKMEMFRYVFLARNMIIRLKARIIKSYESSRRSEGGIGEWPRLEGFLGKSLNKFALKLRFE